MAPNENSRPPSNRTRTASPLPGTTTTPPPSSPPRKKRNTKNQQSSRRIRDAFKRQQRQLSPPSRVKTIYQTDRPVLHENAELIKDLEDCRTTPTTSTILFQKAEEFLSKSKLEIVEQLPLFWKGATKSYDIVQVDTAADLTNALSGGFELIFASHESGLTPTQDWTIPKQIASLGETSGSAFQPARVVAETGHSTYMVGIDVMRRAFLEPHRMMPEDVGINFLDMGNTSGRLFTPSEIADIDLLSQIQRLSSTGTWSGQGGGQPHISNWFILTKTPSCSPFHVDHAGKCTLVVGLEGEKVWHVPKGPNSTISRLFSIHGTMYTSYPEGIAGIKIGPGDCIIMAPGTPHAVTTPSDAMLVGCFFYTAEHFARTIRCVRQSYNEKATFPLWDNDDISAENYNELCIIINHLDTCRLFTPTQLSDIFVEIHELLLQESIVLKASDEFTVAEEYATGSPPSKKAKKRTKTSDGATRTRGHNAVTIEESRKAFFYACAKWWSARQEQ